VKISILAPYIILIFIQRNNIFSQVVHEIQFHSNLKTTTKNIYGGSNSLIFNSSKSVYVHNNAPINDKITVSENNTEVITSDQELFPIYIDYSKNLLLYKKDYGPNLFILSDTVTTITWNKGAETKKILDYECKQAFGKFGGRDYEVWYTLDIPVSMGPHKLNGLPGMILEAKSIDNYVHFIATGYNKASEKKVEIPKIGKVVSWNQFTEMVIESMHKAEALSNDQYTITKDDPPSNSDIEVNKYTIITPYKNKFKKKKK
jgi:GLPGLI family protein